MRGVASAAARACHRGFRSAAALDSLLAHSAATSGGSGAHLALYNYPSFGGAYAAVAAVRFHELHRMPFLALPFSSVEPFLVDDFRCGSFETCYLLDFVGPGRFAVQLAQFIPKVVAFDHRRSTLSRIPALGPCPSNLELHTDDNKCTARAVFEYFAEKCAQIASDDPDEVISLISREDEDRFTTMIEYIEDVDLRWRVLPDTREFQVGLREEWGRLNSIVNPHVFKQLFKLDACSLIARGKANLHSRQEEANKFADNAFKIQLGRGLYGECLATKADGASNLSYEIGLELSRRSAVAGLRPIGAVVFKQRGILKICLRSIDSATDTKMIAKVYGGGGRAGSSSFTLRMDEFKHWILD